MLRKARISTIRILLTRLTQMLHCNYILYLVPKYLDVARSLFMLAAPLRCKDPKPLEMARLQPITKSYHKDTKDKFNPYQARNWLFKNLLGQVYLVECNLPLLIRPPGEVRPSRQPRFCKIKTDA